MNCPQKMKSLKADFVELKTSPRSLSLLDKDILIFQEEKAHSLVLREILFSTMSDLIAHTFLGYCTGMEEPLVSLTCRRPKTALFLPLHAQGRWSIDSQVLSPP